MIQVQPFVDEGLGNSAYLVDIGDGRALVIDPPRYVEPMRAAAVERGLTIAFAVETHLHADFVSGSRELAAHGAGVVGARAAELAFPHRPLDDADELDLGGLTLRAIATPGHTPEHLSYLLLDGARALGLFSGGVLLPGSVARTDLIDPAATEPLARAMWRSLQTRILTLPDDLVVYPTHGGGSFCSAGTEGEHITTIGRERAGNPLLQAPDEDAFVAQLLGSFGSYPTYFARLRAVNQRGPRVIGQFPALAALDLTASDRLVDADAELVDARPIEAFAAGHIPGSLSIALRPSFASWLGWLVEPDRPLLFVLEADQDRLDLVRQALGIGYEQLAGELAGGIETWRTAGRELRVTELTSSPGEIEGTRVIDVRQESEFEAGHVPGALHLELGSLPDAVDAAHGRTTMICAHGERAMTAASLAERNAHRPRVFLGGTEHWARSARRPLDRS